MTKKYQIFISSTFTDMVEERQAAVEAILKAGHIPAGMELFTAGSGPQLEVIKEWIDDSDIYMLLLGGRYGSIEPTTGLSYTELEFRHAKEQSKPIFSVVIRDAALEAKVKNHGLAAVEKNEPQKLKAFKDRVTSEMCEFYSDTKDIKLAVHAAVPAIEKKSKPQGWVRAGSVPDVGVLVARLSKLETENEKLQASAANAKAISPGPQDLFAGRTFDDLAAVLSAATITFPPKEPGQEPGSAPGFAVLATSPGIFAAGVSNQNGSGPRGKALFQFAGTLLSLGLAEHGHVPAGASWQRIQLSSEGKRFAAECQIRLAKSAMANVAKP